METLTHTTQNVISSFVQLRPVSCVWDIVIQYKFIKWLSEVFINDKIRIHQDLREKMIHDESYIQD